MNSYHDLNTQVRKDWRREAWNTQTRIRYFSGHPVPPVPATMLTLLSLALALVTPEPCIALTVPTELVPLVTAVLTTLITSCITITATHRLHLHQELVLHPHTRDGDHLCAAVHECEVCCEVYWCP